MKILYISSPVFADCDFPLIRELQKKGLDVRCYLTIAPFNKRSTLLDIKSVYPHTGIFPSTIYPELDEYRNEIDLTKLYIVNQKYKQKFHPLNLLLYLKLAFYLWKQNADVIHFVLQPTLTMKAIYLLAKKKLVLTLHDPFLHSGKQDKKREKDRIDAFRNIPKIILLNHAQASEFKEHYNIADDRVFFSRLGMYDSITRVSPVCPNFERPYILFFGLISPYKGVEYLLKAMQVVHNTHSDVHLVVAGGGKYYFDKSPYEKLNYVHIINRYIPTNELAGLLKNCLFSVCPYKDATQSGVIQTAFSLNVPMIVTNVGALPDSVDDGITGLIVPPKDVEALSEAIKKLLDSPQLLYSMRSNIDKIWKPKMAWSAIAESYINCYES